MSILDNIAVAKAKPIQVHNNLSILDNLGSP